ncbi:MAG: MBL fold metallo-hydrolase [Cyanobacteriota bacterium]
MDVIAPPAPESGRSPQQLFPGLWLFAPNRDTQGGSAWFLETENQALLIDCPALTQANLAFLEERRERSGWIVLTGRDGHGRCRRLQESLGWPVLVQEQEAYLLPGVENRMAFGAAHPIQDGLHLYWTPGPSPGAAVLHARGGVAGSIDILFCGHLLVPVAPGRLAPRPSPRCFHWPRQRRSVAALAGRLPPGSPVWLASGVSAGAAAGIGLVEDGARQLGEMAEACQAPEGIDWLPEEGGGSDCEGFLIR